MSDTKTVTVNATPLGTLLLILFITLKLTHVIAWSWLWVLAPLWIPIAFVAFLVVIFALVALIAVARR